MAQKKYVSLTRLGNFLDNCKNLFVTKTEITTELAKKSDTSHNHNSQYDAKGAAATVQTNLDGVSNTVNTHTGNADIHVTTTNKTNWDTAYTHSQSAHARVDATNVADSTTNGNILINNTETNVYSHPNSGVSAGTYKSVTVNAQGHITGGSNPTTLSGYGIIDAEAKGTVSTHNTSTSAHNDIRNLITDLTSRLNALADSDDTTLDQLSEIVDYIKSNKALIDSVTTNKINISDIVNNLTTNIANKPLSAAQGVAIKQLIDDLQAGLDSHTHTVTNITDLTVTAAELNHLDGVTSNVQLQLDEISSSLEDKLSSEDFIREINTTANIVGQFGKIAYGSGKFVAIPYSYADDQSKFKYSLDGKNWQNIDAPVETYWNDIIYANGQFIAIGRTSNTQSYVIVSNDGISWTIGNLPSGGTPYSVAYGNGRFVIVGSNTYTAYSTDGINWTPTTLPSSCQAMSVVFGNGRFVAPNPNGYVCAYSTDGISWSMGDIIAGEFSRIVFNNGRFVAVGNNSIQYSDDGVNWTSVSPPMNANWYALTCGEGYYIALGYNKSTFIYSTDGITWQTATASVSDYWCDIEYGNGKFIAVTEGGQNFLTISFTKNEFGLAYESDIENLRNSFPDVYTKTDHQWKLIYDSGEISAIANSISGIDVSGYTNIQILVRIYNDGDSVGSRNGSAIFTARNGKSYQFPVWSNMFSNSINTVYTMATFKLVDGWLICPYASRLIGDANTFEDTEGGTSGNLVPTGSGIMKCTSPLSTLTVSSLDQNSNYYFGMGSRVMVWGWNA